MPFAHGDRLRDRHHLPDKLTGRFTSEGKRRFYLGVLWEVFGVRKIESTATRIQTISTLLAALQGGRNLMNVSQIKVGSINQHTTPLLCGYLKTPESRLRKRIPHCQSFILITGCRAKAVV